MLRGFTEAAKREEYNRGAYESWNSRRTDRPAYGGPHTVFLMRALLESFKIYRVRLQVLARLQRTSPSRQPSSAATS